MKEKWKNIPGYEGYYQASNTGRIRSVDRITSHGHRRKGKILAACPNKAGYIIYVLSKNGKTKSFRGHRLVAKTWAGKSQLLCCHNDGNKINNVVSNLRWDDCCGNQQDRIKHGTTSRIKIVRSDGTVFEGIREAARITGLDSSGISKSCRGKLKTCGGFSWRYV